VYTQAVDADLADAFALPVDHGAIINEVVEDSPAEEAGLEEDDIIIAFNGSKVRDDEDLTDLVYDAEPGDQVTLTIFRDGKEQQIQAELGRRPRSLRWFDHGGWFEPPRPPRPPRPPKPPNVHTFHFDDYDWEHPYIGVTLLDVSKRTARSMGSDSYGVLIDDVEGDSPAAKAGLQPGDLIVAIDDEDVREAADVRDIIADKEEGDIARVTFLRERKKSTVEVSVELDEDGYYYGGPRVISLPDLPKIDIRIPELRGLHLGRSLDGFYFDSEEYQEEMKDLARELKEMKEELGDLERSLD